MDRKEKIEYYQKAKSKNAESVEAPFLPAAKKENLESVVSLRFSGYELALLRKVCEKKKTTLSSLIRNTVISALEKDEFDQKIKRFVHQRAATATGLLVNLEEKSNSYQASDTFLIHIEPLVTKN